jgi:hypothetical protein
MAVVMDIIVARDIIIVVVMTNVVPGMVIQVRRVVPMAMTAPSAVGMPAVAIVSVETPAVVAVVSVAMMHMANVDVNAATTEMKPVGSCLLGIEARDQGKHGRNQKSKLRHVWVPPRLGG